MKLNIGCGRNPMEGYINLDCMPLPGVDELFDLEECHGRRLRFPDDHFEEVQAIHTLEHINHILPVMEELWRVSKHGALFHIQVPYGGCDIAWEDPTHVRQFFPQSFTYFSQAAYKRADYGYRGDWITEEVVLVVPVEAAQGFESKDDCIKGVQHWRNVAVELRARLRCCKPVRDPLTAEDPVVVVGLGVIQTPPAIKA